MTVIVEWAEVEVVFASQYHLLAHDIFKMPWRRFRILFLGVFDFKDEAGDDRGLGKLAATVDWPTSPALDTAPFTGTQIHVGKES